MPNDTNHTRVLIAEDEKPLSRALQLKLEHEGYYTAIAHNGQECLALLESEHFDVLLLDMMMPVLDGFHVLQSLQHKTDKPVVFVLSNLSTPDDEQHILELGAKKYFVKSNTPLSVIIEEVKKAKA